MIFFVLNQPTIHPIEGFVTYPIYDHSKQEISSVQSLERHQITASIAAVTGHEDASYEIVDTLDEIDQAG
jgi:hypothetical protein